MILGKSIDKVKIKKIPLRAWSLTDEINATLQALLENNEKVPEDKMHLLKAYYESMPAADWNKKPTLKLIQGGKEEIKKTPEATVTNIDQAKKEEPTKVETDPFELAKLAAAAETNPAATPAPDAQTPASTTTPDAQAATSAAVASTTSTENPAAATENKTETTAATATTAPVETKVETPTTASTQTVTATLNAVPAQPVITPVKEITVNDFLQMRKEGFRFIPTEEKISAGYTVLYDITFDQILFFSEKPFKPGQQVVIEFCIPKSFTLCANIKSIVNISVGSRIINQQPVNYRVIASLPHSHLGDRTLIRNFLNSIDQRENIGQA